MADPVVTDAQGAVSRGDNSNPVFTEPARVGDVAYVDVAPPSGKEHPDYTVPGIAGVELALAEGGPFGAAGAGLGLGAWADTRRVWLRIATEADPAPKLALPVDGFVDAGSNAAAGSEGAGAGAAGSADEIEIAAGDAGSGGGATGGVTSVTGEVSGSAGSGSGAAGAASEIEQTAGAAGSEAGAAGDATVVVPPSDDAYFSAGQSNVYSAWLALSNAAQSTPIDFAAILAEPTRVKCEIATVNTSGTVVTTHRAKALITDLGAGVHELTYATSGITHSATQGLRIGLWLASATGQDESQYGVYWTSPAGADVAAGNIVVHVHTQGVYWDSELGEGGGQVDTVNSLVSGLAASGW